MGQFGKIQSLKWKLVWKVKMKVRQATRFFFGAEQISWNRGTLINTSCATYKRRTPQGKMFVFFLQDALKTAFKLKI